ncbi:universal stress protein [Salinirubellus sp. GCM10025818]|uniref:universal stress protein n=1 Tax=Salinirubellus TaxID=2162630 RepID=UPI0030D02CFD
MERSGELTILVPVDVSANEPPSLGILDRIGPIEVVILGYFPVPDQAEPALIREEYGPEAADRLETIADAHHGSTAVLVFTHDREATIDRIADQHGCNAVLIAGETSALDRILVPLRGDVNLDRILSVVADLLLAGEETATLFHSVAEGADPSGGELLLVGAVDRLVEYGVDRDRIDRRLSEGGDPRTDIVEFGGEYDLVVLGETEPSLRERIIGDVLSGIVDDVEVPALIVRDVE